jgi:hypothetical protein
MKRIREFFVFFFPAVRPACLAAAIGLLFCACATAPTLQNARNDYPDLRASRPLSILVMPPVNRSPDVNASATFLATATVPLAEAGYYVIPVALSTETFKQNGVTVAEEAHTIEFGRLREIFGADAALYITIYRFGARYQILNSAVEAEASARLVDLRSGVELWSGYAAVSDNSMDSMGSIDSGESLLALLIGAAVSQIINNVSDSSFYVGRRANYQLLSAGEGHRSLLYGQYHPEYGED